MRMERTEGLVGGHKTLAISREAILHIAKTGKDESDSLPLKVMQSEILRTE